MKVREELSNKTTDTLTKLLLLFKKGQKMVTSDHIADIVKLRRRVTELEGELEERKLQLQVLIGLAEEDATLQSKGK